MHTHMHIHTAHTQHTKHTHTYTHADTDVESDFAAEDACTHTHSTDITDISIHQHTSVHTHIA